MDCFKNVFYKMYNITLISTRHDEVGKCNSNELYKIIESINPELIFEEIPPSYFDKYYIDRSCNNLETDTINKYLETHDVKKAFTVTTSPMK